jgi:PilZ domain
MSFARAATYVADAERRQSERFITHCSALIRLSSTLTFPCRVRNLSMEAAQVACAPRFALLAQPPTATRLRLIELSIALNVAGTVRGVTTQAVPLYCIEPENNDAASHEMLLGVKFLSLDAGAKQSLADYLGALIFA